MVRFQTSALNSRVSGSTDPGTELTRKICPVEPTRSLYNFGSHLAWGSPSFIFTWRTATPGSNPKINVFKCVTKQITFLLTLFQVSVGCLVESRRIAQHDQGVSFLLCVSLHFDHSSLSWAALQVSFRSWGDREPHTVQFQERANIVCVCVCVCFPCRRSSSWHKTCGKAFSCPVVSLSIKLSRWIQESELLQRNGSRRYFAAADRSWNSYETSSGEYLANSQQCIREHFLSFASYFILSGFWVNTNLLRPSGCAGRRRIWSKSGLFCFGGRTGSRLEPVPRTCWLTHTKWDTCSSLRCFITLCKTHMCFKDSLHIDCKPTGFGRFAKLFFSFFMIFFCNFGCFWKYHFCLFDELGAHFWCRRQLLISVMRALSLPINSNEKETSLLWNVSWLKFQK